MTWWHAYGAMVADGQAEVLYTVGPSTQHPDEVPEIIDAEWEPFGLVSFDHLGSFDHEPTDDDKVSLLPPEGDPNRAGPA